jgi:hypothetical protein
MKIDNLNIESISENISNILDKKIVLIEKGLSVEALKYLNEKIRNNSIKLVLVCDPGKNSSESIVRNLDVFNYLTTITAVSILVNSSKELNDISTIKNIERLVNFSISGNYSKKIDIELLKSFNELTEVEFDELDNSSKYKLIEQLTLEKLSIDSLDIGKLKPNLQLKFLKINKELKNSEVLSSIFPNLNSLALLNCKKIADFNFLTELKKLNFLLLNSTNIAVLPKLADSVSKIQLLSSKCLEDVSSLLGLTNLDKLAITDSRVNYDTVKELAKFKLSNFYYTSKIKADNLDFEGLSLKNGFTNSLRGF